LNDDRRDHAEHSGVAFYVAEDVAVPDPCSGGVGLHQHGVPLTRGDVDGVSKVRLVEREAVLSEHQLRKLVHAVTASTKAKKTAKGFGFVYA